MLTGRRQPEAVANRGVVALKRDWREIRTLASEETGALNQRLRPLGQPANRISLTGRIRTIDLGITTVSFTVPRSTN